MLRQASLAQLRHGELTREDGYLVVVTRFYPRGLSRELFDEYRSDLAPEATLLRDLKKYSASLNHNAAFRACHYEERFWLPLPALEQLRRLAELSDQQNVYLFCQCALGQCCHREILLLIAAEQFNAIIGPTYHQYRRFFRPYERKSA